MTARSGLPDSSTTGRVLRVSGPLVEVTGLVDVAMSELVELGAQHLPGEIVSITDGVATVQAYEYTGGLAPGDVTSAIGQPLSASLGPGLLGGTFDGLLRPLHGAGTWLTPGDGQRRDGRTWDFEPTAAVGEELAAGDTVGIVRPGGPLELRALVPHGCAGAVEQIVAAGRYDAQATLAVLGGQQVRMGQSWPVRQPRPHQGRIDGGAPLVTGQRVLDLLYPVALGSSAAVPGGFG
ncbi:MAG: ATPase, partial [Actinomycetota bacterium]|nr:ATPase [Actinomycetota bacterium]